VDVVTEEQIGENDQPKELNIFLVGPQLTFYLAAK
jgi:hypothetical protein